MIPAPPPSARAATTPSGTGITVWFTGLPGAGTSTLAAGCAARLLADGRAVVVLDGDELRAGLNRDLGFSPEDRAENVRRIGEVARLVAGAGVVALVPVVSPYRADRDRVRQHHAGAGLAFVEVHVATSRAVCEARDPKDLYRRARSGALAGLTGVDAPYEPPTGPELRVTLEAEADLGGAVASVLALVSAADRSGVPTAST
ncbi:MAG: adenylyl-sulfate kinase [Actinomycetota bacterium]|nr:adenylyl-sulfate kinase [Actinomycetota bacterium]